MSFSIQCIGYDIRCSGLTECARHAEWGNRHLLKADVEAPLSVDTVCWPSVFQLEGVSGAHLAHKSPSSEETFPLVVRATTLRQESLNLWHDPVEMCRHFSRAPSTTDGVAIAVVLVVQKEEEWKWSRRLAAGPAVHPVPEHWAELGYDVADEDLTTFLSDSFTAAESELLRPMWAPRLNGFGLFGGAADALAFCAASEPSAGEHAPLFAFGMLRDPMVWHGGMRCAEEPPQRS